MSGDPASEILLETKHLQLVRRAGWDFVRRPQVCGIVVVVALTHEHRLLLIEQYRVPVASNVIELPAGLADVVDGSEEPLEEAARRELLEETGYQAADLIPLFHGPPSAGITDEDVSFFLATGVEKVGPGGGDAAENIRVHEVPLENIDQWLDQQVAEGKALDVKVYAGLYAVRHY